MGDLDERKSQLRSSIRQARKQRSTEEREQHAEKVAELLTSRISPQALVGGFLPMKTEPDIGLFLTRHSQRGGKVIVPVMEPKRQLSWAEWWPGAETAQKDSFPVTQPVGPRHTFEDFLLSETSAESQTAAPVLLMPALAIDGNGMRLGQGGGYYDRLLARLSDEGTAVSLVGVLFSQEFLEPGSIPAAPWDQPVDAVVTEKGFFPLGNDPLRTGS